MSMGKHTSTHLNQDIPTTDDRLGASVVAPVTPAPIPTYPTPIKPNDIGIAYILWFVLGVFGGHRYYLNRKGSAIAMTVVSCTVVGLVVTGVWAIVDLFLIPGIFREATNDR